MRVRIIVIVCIGILNYFQAEAQVPLNGLVAYYPFNGNANDESGNVNNGIINGAVLTADRFGNPNSAFILDGITSNISISNTFDFAPRTVDLWFNTADIDYDIYGSIFISDNPNLNTGSTGIFIKSIDGVKKLFLTKSEVIDTVDINANQWYNVVIAEDSDKNVFFYLDGNLVGNKVYSLNFISDEGLSKTFLGCNRTQSVCYFKGMIDDIRIYDRALDPSEILDLYNAPATLNSINGLSSICQGTKNLEFNVNLIQGANYNWTYSGTGATITGSSNSIKIDFTDQATSGILKVTSTVPNFLSQSQEVLITVNSCSQIPTGGLMAYYPFNGNANDESGNSYNGIINGAGLTSNRFGIQNSAYFFDGLSSNISIPNTFDFAPRTVSLWFNTADIVYSIYGSIYITDNPNLMNGNTGVFIKYVDGIRKLFLTKSEAIVSLDINANQWYNVVISEDSDKTVSFYLNGNLVDQKTYALNYISAAGLNSTFLGCNRTQSVCYFKGMIDDIRIYNRGLSSVEVLNLYNADSYISEIEGSQSVCKGQKDVMYKVMPQTDSVKSWNYSGSGAIIAGNSNSIFINFGDSATSGILSVVAAGNDTTSYIRELYISLHACIFDTLHTKIYDTLHITVYDTVHVNFIDTVRIYRCDTLTVYNEVSVTDTLFIDAVLTGINSFHNIIKAYPNPTKDFLIIDNGQFDAMTGCRLKIINSTGSIVFESLVNSQKFTIDLNTCGGKGTYFIQIVDSSSQIIEAKKIILL